MYWRCEINIITFVKKKEEEKTTIIFLGYQNFFLSSAVGLPSKRPWMEDGVPQTLMMECFSIQISDYWVLNGDFALFNLIEVTVTLGLKVQVKNCMHW